MSRPSDRQCLRRRPSVTSAVGASILLLFAVQPAMAQSPDGLWQSDGYGLLIEISGPKLSAFQTTSISCMPWWTAQRRDRPASGEVVFDRGDADIRVTPGPLPDILILREGTSIGSMTLRRAGARPRTCSDTLANTPENNYAVFWQTFAEEFVLFPRYQANWDAVDRKYRPMVESTTSPDQLFNILRTMILPFHNAHTNINAGPIHRQYLGYRPASAIGSRLNETSSRSIDQILALFTEQGHRSNAVIAAHYSRSPLRPLANDILHFGWLRDSIAYLSISAFDGFAKDGGEEQNGHALEAALDTVFREAGGMHGLVLDVRTNVGGADPFCLAVAARLTNARYLAYSKVVRTNVKGPLRLSPPLAIWVEPSSRPGFRGNVVLLHGPDSISGGETFPMALMGRRPHVVRIGENTQGVFSDVWGRRLPNGWTFGVPSELYLTASGQSFDRYGVPPDIRAPVFRERDLASGRDPALERAQQVLAPILPGTAIFRPTPRPAARRVFAGLVGR